jgi:hypothetical protein
MLSMLIAALKNAEVRVDEGGMLQVDISGGGGGESPADILPSPPPAPPAPAEATQPGTGLTLSDVGEG